ncbi:MAG: DHHA1 domain-containing protein [Chloroflexota bacterium]
MSRELDQVNRRLAHEQFDSLLSQVREVNGANLLAAQVEVSGIDGLREMADWFRDKVPSGAAVLGTVNNDKPVIVATVSDDLIARGLKAGDLAREVAQLVGGNGGGRPNMAQAGGRDPEKLPSAGGGGRAGFDHPGQLTGQMHLLVMDAGETFPALRERLLAHRVMNRHLYSCRRVRCSRIRP